MTPPQTPLTDSLRQPTASEREAMREEERLREQQNLNRPENDRICPECGGRKPEHAADCESMERLPFTAESEP